MSQDTWEGMGKKLFDYLALDIDITDMVWIGGDMDYKATSKKIKEAIEIQKNLLKRIEELESWALTGPGVFADYVLPEMKKLMETKK